MIKKWVKFNESIESFTEEMAQEIIYYLGEDCFINDEIKNLLNKIYDPYLEFITMYETSYEEMTEYTKELYKKAKENSELEIALIEIYTKIREELSIYPEIHEIEDIYLSMIENYNFDFYIKINKEKEIIINLVKWHHDLPLSGFIELCKLFEGTIKRISSNKYKTILDTCNYQERIIEFKIKLLND